MKVKPFSHRLQDSRSSLCLVKMVGETFVKSCLLTLFTVGIVSINSVSLAAVLRSKLLTKQPTTPFLVSLFVADLLQGVLGTGVSAALSWADTKYLSNVFVQFHSLGLIFPPTASLTSVAALAAVKMVTIIWPLRIPNILTRKKIIFILVPIWIVPLCFGVMHFFSVAPEFSYPSKRSWEGAQDSWITKSAMFVIFLPCFLVLSGSYIIIFIVVIKQTIKIRRQTAPPEENAVQMPDMILTAFKSSKSIIAVITIYIVLFLAPSIFFLISVGNSEYENYSFWLFWMPYTEGFWNSLLYICLNKAAKKELRKMFCFGSAQSELNNGV